MPAELHITATVPEVNEGAAAVFEVERTGDMGSTASVEWQCQDVTGICNFDPWDATRLIALPTFEAETGDREVTVTLMKALGATIATPAATVKILDTATVPPEPIPPEPIPPEPIPPQPDSKRPKYPPAPVAGRTRNVPEDYPTVMAAYQDAPPGTTISVKSGISTGELKFARNLDPDNPVIIRSRSLLGAILDQRVHFTGKGHWLHGFRQTYKTTDMAKGAIGLDADFIWLTKLEIQSPHGIDTGQLNRADVKIGWCTFNGRNPGGSSVTNISIKMPDGGHYPKPSDGPRRIYIYYNDFDDDGPRPSGAMEDHCIYFGDSKPKGDDVVCMEDVEIDHNLIREDNKRVRGFYMKRGAYLFQNNILGAKYNWGIRHGGKARIEGNIARGTAKLILNGSGHTVVNNTWQKSCDLYCGASKGGSGPYYQAADYATLDMNAGVVNIGYKPSSHSLDIGQGGKVNNCTIWKHSGTINKVLANCDAATYTYHDKMQEGANYLPRVLLTPADVGVGG
jgi:hypothetical protein